MDELRRIRHLRGMSQEDLAKASGVSDFTISELEGGKRPNPRPSTLRKLADALGVDVAALYGEEVPSPKEPEPFSLEWARTAAEGEFYRQVMTAPEEDTDRLDKLSGELNRVVSRPIKRIYAERNLAERNNRTFNGPKPGRDEHDHERMKERRDALFAEVNRRRPPFAWLRSSDEGNECHWFIPPEQRTEEHHARVDKFFGGEPYEDEDPWKDAQKKPRGYKEAFPRAA